MAVQGSEMRPGISLNRAARPEGPNERERVSQSQVFKPAGRMTSYDLPICPSPLRFDATAPKPMAKAGKSATQQVWNPALRLPNLSLPCACAILGAPWMVFRYSGSVI